MKIRGSAILVFCLLSRVALATNQEAATNGVERIDLATVLRLANARSLDVQTARERLAEARANYSSAQFQFLPWLSPGAAYRGHDNLTQDAPGTIINADKEAYSAGLTVKGQWELGETIFRRLAARQSMNAAAHSVRAGQNETAYRAARAYFDLLKAQAAVAVASESVAIASNYLGQIRQAVSVGLAFRSEALRVEVQQEKNETTLVRAREMERVAGARLAEILSLESVASLAGAQWDFVPMNLAVTNATLESLVAQALANRPELAADRASVLAARRTADSTVYGPLVPNIGAQAFVGGFGGGVKGRPYSFGESDDYQVTLGWRIGPGGLLDTSRQDAAKARVRIAELNARRTVDEVRRQIIEAHTSVQSQVAQLASTGRALQAAQETLKLSQERKEFAVANVLEVIQAEQELTSARLEHANAIAEFNKAQYALLHALGHAAAEQK